MRGKFTQKKIKNAFTSTIGNFLNLQSFFILLLFTITLAWIPDGIINLLSMYIPETYLSIIQLGFGFSILVLLFVIGNIFVKKRFSKIEVFSDYPTKRKNLIIFLSPNFAEISKINSIKDFKNIKTPWQMPILAINYHLPKLENLVVIVSSKSKKQFGEFKNLVEKVFSNNKINIIPAGLNENIDFENMEDIKRIINESYELLKNKYNAKEKEIIIDITGGQKLVSIVGAIQTLIEGREFEYVSTTNYEIKSFDVRYFEDE